MMQHVALRVLTVLGIPALTAAASFAAPVGVDGTVGAEWAGVPSVHVDYQSGAPIGNFASPTQYTNNVGYSIQVRDDGQYYYVALQSDASTGGLDFANLYFDTNPPAGDGSDVGFEANNNRYFIAGGSGYSDASSYLTSAVSSSASSTTIELAIDNAFFTSGPLAGTAWPNGYPAATGDVTLRLSQSFGYSVAGGASFGDTRLGTASVAAAAVPTPAASTAGFALLGLGALAARVRARRSAAC